MTRRSELACALAALVLTFVTIDISNTLCLSSHRSLLIFSYVENGDNWTDGDVDMEYSEYWKMKEKWGESLSPGKSWPPSRVMWLNGCITRRGGLSLFAQSELSITSPASLPTTSQPPSCIVCLELFTEKRRGVYELKCGHLYHVSCLRTWMRRSKNCPTCRGDIKTIGEEKKVEKKAGRKKIEDVT